MKTNTQLTALIPPDHATEGAVLSIILNHEHAVYRIANRLRAEHFEHVVHRSIATSILQLLRRSKPVHSLTVFHEMTRTEGTTVETAKQLTLDMIGKFGGRSPQLIEALHAELVAGWQRRAMLTELQELSRQTTDPKRPIGETLASIPGRTEHIITGGLSEPTTAELIDKLLEDGKALAESGRTMLGPTVFGIPQLDAAIDGAAPGGLVVVAAWTGNGKTVLFNTALTHLANAGVPAFSWSGEQAEHKQISGVIGGIARVNKRSIEKGMYLNDPSDPRAVDRVTYAAKHLRKEGGHIFRSGLMDEDRLITTITYQFYANKIRIFFFDRKELFAIRGIDNDDELGLLLSKLRSLATNLGVWICIASQVIKSHMSRLGSMAELSDVLGQVGVVSAATAVVIVHRWERYGLLEDKAGNSYRGRALLRVVKNSYGMEVDVPAWFRPDWGLFFAEDDYDPDFNRSPLEFNPAAGSEDVPF